MNSPANGVNSDYFSAKYIATKYLNEGDYVFRARADDGIRVYLNNKLIINRWTDSSYREDAIKIHVCDVNGLPLHKLRVEYYDKTGNSIVYL